MDHFCPSYFALLGPLDRSKLAQDIIPGHWAGFLDALTIAGVRYLLAGDLALTLQGLPRDPVDLELFLDSEEDNLRHFIENLESLVLKPDEREGLIRCTGKGTKGSILLRMTDAGGFQIGSRAETDLSFEVAFERRVVIKSGSTTINLLSLEDWVLVRSGCND